MESEIFGFFFLKFFVGPFEREKEVLHYEAMQDLNYPRDMPFDGNVSNDDWYYNRMGFAWRKFSDSDSEYQNFWASLSDLYFFGL